MKMLYGDHLVFKIPGDEIVGNETVRFSYTMRKNWGCLEAFLSLFHVSLQTEIRNQISITHHFPHLSLYILSLFSIYLTIQRSLKTMPWLPMTQPLDFLQFFSKYQPQNCCCILPAYQFPNRLCLIVKLHTCVLRIEFEMPQFSFVSPIESKRTKSSTRMVVLIRSGWCCLFSWLF